MAEFKQFSGIPAVMEVTQYANGVVIVHTRPLEPSVEAEGVVLTCATTSHLNPKKAPWHRWAAKVLGMLKPSDRTAGSIQTKEN